MRLICEYFLDQSKPQVFNPHDSHNVILEHDKSFEAVLISLSENGINTEKLTIFEFYTRIEFLEKKYQKQKANVGHKQL